MQRVATELYAAFGAHPDVVLDGVLLRTTWEQTHLRTFPFLVRAYRDIRRKALAGEIDVVLFSSMVTAALAPLLRPVLAPRGIRMAAIVHGRDVTLPVPPYQWYVPRVLGALDAVLPVSQATGGECLRRGLAHSKLHVVPNGVDTTRFATPAEPSVMRRALKEALGDPSAPLLEDALLLCSVGRQVERKGFAWFVDHVMPRLPEAVHYWLAGDGPEAEAIDAAIDRHGLNHRVRRLGRVTESELEALYRGADLFVMPNRPVAGDMEGFGVVMLEAGLGATPTVAASLEGIRDVISEGINGHLVPSGDASAFADAIRPYYIDRTLLSERAAQTYAHTVATFGWPAVADRYVHVLQMLMRAT